MRLCLLSLLTLILTLAAPAFAVDGVLEINQTCAVQTGCFPGDAAGLPVTITTAGSYRLTSNLDIPDINTDGIVVNANDVGIDLNNFAIIGPVVCTTQEGAPAACPAQGTGWGVRGLIPAGDVCCLGTSVKNGSISGMGGAGVVLGRHAEVTNLRVHGNSGSGIVTLNGAVIFGNTAADNGGSGIQTYFSTVTGNTVLQNSGTGLAVYDSVVHENYSSHNGLYGIRVSTGAVVSGNMVQRNRGSWGIYSDAMGGIVVTGNSVTNNFGIGISLGGASVVSENSVSFNDGDGIQCGEGCVVSENSVVNNDGDGIDSVGRVSGNAISGNGRGAGGGYGLYINPDATYSENTITNNVTGAVTGSGVNMGDNYCAGTGVNLSSCP